MAGRATGRQSVALAAAPRLVLEANSGHHDRVSGDFRNLPTQIVRARRVTFAFALVALLDGCTLLFDVSGLTGGAPSGDASADSPGTTNDGSSADALDAPSTFDGVASVDAPADSGTSESGGGVDAAADAVGDAGVDGDAAPLPFCSTVVPPPTFCQDFDEATSPGEGWADSYSYLGGALSLDETESVSPPTSLLTTFPASSGAPNAYLAQSFAQPGTSLTLDLRIRIDEMDQSIVAVAVIELGTSQMRILVAKGDWVFEQDWGSSGYLDSYPSVAPTVGQWQHVVWTMTMGTPMTATIAIDGNTLLPTTSLQSELVATAPRIDVGVRYATSPAASWTIHYDNVIYDAQ